MRPTTLATWAVALAVLVLPTSTAAQCTRAPSDGVSLEASWRQRLAPWIPGVTLELSNRFDRELGGRRAIGALRRPGVREPGRRSMGRESGLDWQLAAHWDVVELVESLSPAPKIELVPDVPSECEDPSRAEQIYTEEP